jgi:hypothetical protein
LILPLEAKLRIWVQCISFNFAVVASGLKNYQNRGVCWP